MTFPFHRASLYVLLFAALTLTACSNPVSGEEEEHAEFEIMALVIDGAVVASYNTENGARSQDTFVLTVPESQTSSQVTLQLWDHDNEVINDTLDEEFSMRVEFDNGSVASAQMTGRWTFTVSGLQAGETKMHVVLLHNGHEDATFPDIDVRVAN